MHDFKECLAEISVDDIHATGPYYTWWNGQDANPTYKKLDRALGNTFWFNEMSHASVFFGPRGLSDHCPILLHTGIELPKVQKPFQFFNFMIDLDGYRATVLEAWGCSISGNPLYVLAEKLRRLKKALIALNRQHGHLPSNVQSLRSDLHATKHSIDLISSSSIDCSLSRSKERLLSHKLWKALALEESLARQKSRIQWLSQGDKNSKFFFSCTKSRWNSNKIISIENGDGCVVSGHSEIKDVAINYFKDLFHASPPCNEISSALDCLNWDKTVSTEHSLLLTKIVTNEEIYDTLKIHEA